MAFNGSGTFVRLYNWVNDKAASIKVRADRMDNEMDGFATGLSTCITKDGQTTITANIPFAGRKITGYGSSSTPNSRTDVPSLGQAQDGTLNWVDGGGSADAITAAYSPAITALVDGQICNVRATAANTTTTPTFSPNGLTARTIVKNGGQALVAGDIYGDGHQLQLRYDLSNTRWELMNPLLGTGGATTAGTQTLTNKTINLASNTVTGTLAEFNTACSDANFASLTGAETLTNKTLTDVIDTNAVVCTSTLTKNSNTTLSDITGMTKALTAGKTYVGSAFIYTSTQAGGLKLSLDSDGTLTATGFRGVVNFYDGSGAYLAGTVAATLPLTLATNANPVGASYCLVDFTIEVNVAGSIKFQGAQNTSDATNTSFQQYSNMRVQRIN